MRSGKPVRGSPRPVGQQEFVAKELENAAASAAEDGQAPKEEKVEEVSNYSSENTSPVPLPTPTSSPLCATSCSASDFGLATGQPLWADEATHAYVRRGWKPL